MAGQRAHSIELNPAGLHYARELIASGQFIADQRNEWGEHQPSKADENEFIRTCGIVEYGKWHLAVDGSHSTESKARYRFPFGDLKTLRRSALLAARARARQYGYGEIEKAAAELLEQISAASATQPRR